MRPRDGGQTQMPPETMLERAHGRCGKESERQRLDVFVVDVVRNAIREDVVDVSLDDAEPRRSSSCAPLRRE